MTDRVDISMVLSEMRALQARAQGFEPATVQSDIGVDRAQRGAEFEALLGQAVDKVNSLQKQSGALAQSFERGDPDVTLSQVVVASEKASVAFEAMSEVRNRLVNAYEDIMNMPI